MNTVGHRHNPAPEQATVRTSHRWTVAAALAGVLVVAAAVAPNVAAVPELPANIALAVALTAFFGAAIAAIPPAQAKPTARRFDPRPDDGTPAVETDEVRRPSEDELVRVWRTTRLTALGVPEHVALVLADDPSFSHHELERLLERGCPLGTALRILQPD